MHVLEGGLLESEELGDRNAQSLGELVESFERQILLTVFNALVLLVFESEPTHVFLLQPAG